MDVFLEKQFIKWWWLTMLILAIIVIVFGTGYYATEQASEGTAVTISIICCLIGFPIVFSLLFLRLETRIDEKGIFTYFRPFGFTRKFYSWEEVEKCYVRSYSPLTEYGGWGLRTFGKDAEAYNISGNKGIQIVTNEGKKFLIGTQKPKEAQAVINNYKPIATDEV